MSYKDFVHSALRPEASLKHVQQVVHNKPILNTAENHIKHIICMLKSSKSLYIIVPVTLNSLTHSHFNTTSSTGVTYSI